MEILPKLIELLSDKAEVSSHAFHAVSCLVRSFEEGMKAFISMGGLECLLGLVQSQDREKLVIKSMFLISSFNQDSPSVCEELIKLNAIEKIVSTLQIKSEYNTRLEQTLSALLSFIESPEAIKRCQKKDLNLKETLEQIILHCDGKEECQVS